MKKYFKLASLGFSIEGNNNIVDSLLNEFSSIGTDNPCNTIVDFIFTNELQEIGSFVKIENIFIGQNWFQINDRALIYQVHENDQGKLRVLLKYNDSFYNRSSLKRSAYQFKNFNYLTPAEEQAKNFMYNIFDYITALCLVNMGACYLHASTFKKNDKCVALMAWGGVGKTSAMLKFVIEDNWKYMSDDLGLIDQKGIIWRTPKHMQIYAYNIIGQPILEECLMRDRTFLDKLSWHIRLLKNGTKGVRRRISAESLLGDANVEINGKLTDLFYLERSDVPDFAISKMSLDNIVERSTSILLDELQPLTDYSLAMHSTSVKPIIPSLSNFVKKCSTILHKSFSSTTPYIVLVPIDSDPNELAEFLRSQINMIN